MRHLIVLAVLTFAIRASAADPYLAFSDLASGSATGNGDTSGGLVANADGAIVTVWGRFLGDAQGSSTIAVGGVAPARVFYWGPAVPPWSPANLSTRHGLQVVIFEVAGATPAGATAIVATVGGHASNPLPFTVRGAPIRFVATGGDDGGDGTWAHPWLTLPHAVNALPAGGICYALDGVSQTALNDYNACVNIGVDGTAAQPRAIVAYPGARCHVGASGVDRGFGNWVSSRGGYAVYWTIAKFDLTAGTSAISNMQTGYRVVGNRIGAPTASAPEGTVEGSGDHLAVVGNEFTQCGVAGCSKLYHPLYISTPRTDTGARLPTETDREIAWNWFHANNANRAINIYSEQASTAFMTDHRVHHNWIEDQVGDGMLIGYYVCGENWVHDNVVLRAGLGPEPTMSDPVTHAGIQIDAGHESYAGTTIHVWNNTVVDCGWSGAASPGSSGAWYIHDTARYALDLRDDITVSAGQPYIAAWSDASLPTVAGPNLWFGAGAAPAFDHGAVVGDPLFVDRAGGDLRLQAGSPAIDVGAALGGVVALDFAAMPRPQGAGPDLGAFESDGASGTTTGGTTTGGTTTGGTTTGGTTTGGTTTGGTTTGTTTGGTTSGTTTAGSSTGGSSHGGGHGCGSGAATAALALAAALAVRLRGRR